MGWDRSDEQDIGRLVHQNATLPIKSKEYRHGVHKEEVAHIPKNTGHLS